MRPPFKFTTELILKVFLFISYMVALGYLALFFNVYGFFRGDRGPLPLVAPGASTLPAATIQTVSSPTTSPLTITPAPTPTSPRFNLDGLP